MLACLQHGPQNRGEETGQSPDSKFPDTLDVFLGQPCYPGESDLVDRVCQKDSRLCAL